jgi:hypothetical protein
LKRYSRIDSEPRYCTESSFMHNDKLVRHIEYITESPISSEVIDRLLKLLGFRNAEFTSTRGRPKDWGDPRTGVTRGLVEHIRRTNKGVRCAHRFKPCQDATLSPTASLTYQIHHKIAVLATFRASCSTNATYLERPGRISGAVHRQYMCGSLSICCLWKQHEHTEQHVPVQAF